MKTQLSPNRSEALPLVRTNFSHKKALVISNNSYSSFSKAWWPWIEWSSVKKFWTQDYNSDITDVMLPISHYTTIQMSCVALFCYFMCLSFYIFLYYMWSSGSLTSAYAVSFVFAINTNKKHIKTKTIDILYCETRYRWRQRYISI